jgi:hypothetical protein
LRLTFVAAGVAGFLAPSVDLPSWQLTADVTIGSALRFGHPFDSSRAVLRGYAVDSTGRRMPVQSQVVFRDEYGNRYDSRGNRIK